MAGPRRGARCVAAAGAGATTSRLSRQEGLGRAGGRSRDAWCLRWWWRARLQTVYKVGWTKDGQVLTVATTNGQLLTFLAALPVVFDFHLTKVSFGEGLVGAAV